MTFSLQYTPLDDISAIHQQLNKSFKSGLTRSLDFRRRQLLQLAHLVQDNADAFYAALSADLHKQKLEVSYQELGPIVRGAIEAAESLGEWAKPDTVKVEDWKSSWNATLYKAPKGVALIISPWNYPVVLTFQPFIGALAAGCTVVLKPSEITPHTSQLIADLLPKYLDSSAYRVINGAVKETTALLDLPWDHIFYTGNGKVGRIVATAAAKHLTPCTLELGGQSPVVIDASADLKLAAKRVLYGKSLNAGQLCVSPNHVFVLRSKQDEFIEALKESYHEFWPKGPLDQESTFGRIVTPSHFGRVQSYLKNSKGSVVIGGKTEGERGMETTVVKDVKYDDSLLQEELFGPLLAVVPIDSIDEAVTWINEHDNPLAMYIFTNDASVKEKFVNMTSSGSIVFNDTTSQLAVFELPFGGHGGSGYGNQHGVYTFNTFTHLRSSIDVPSSVEPHLALRYAPYTDQAIDIMGATLKLTIPN